MRTFYVFLAVFTISIFNITTLSADKKKVKVIKKSKLEKFLDKYDYYWNHVPTSRGNSAILGNGLLGSTIWSGENDVIHWTLGRSDVYTTNTTIKSRIPIGKLVLKLRGHPVDSAMHFSLYNAQADGLIKTGFGTFKWRSIIPYNQMACFIEYSIEGTEQATFDIEQIFPVDTTQLRKALLALINEKNYEINNKKNRISRKILNFSNPIYKPLFEELKVREETSELFKYPVPQRSKEQGINCLLQSFSNGGGFVFAWGTIEEENGKYLMAYTIDYFKNGQVNTANAVRTIRKALDKDFEITLKKHRKWWKNFFSKSFVSTPDDFINKFYWMQIYKMGAAMRSDSKGVLLDQIGPWYRSTPWGKVWCNMNVEIAYQSIMTSNHLNLMKPYIKIFTQNQGKFKNAVSEDYKHDGAIAVGRVMDIFGNTSSNLEYSNLIWIMHNIFIYCRYTNNEQLLTGSFYNTLKGAVQYMINRLEKDEDGIYHTPLDISPEYDFNRYPDTTYSLSLVRWGLETLINLNRQMYMNDLQSSEWQDILKHLPPLPINENGLMVADALPFSKSHRYYSHLIAFFPLRLLNPDNPIDYNLCKLSYNQWDHLAKPKRRGKKYKWKTFSYFGAATMAAWLYDGNQAFEQLEKGINSVTPNTFYKGRGPSIASVFSGVTTIGEMLIQSATTNPENYRIKIFPAIPENWLNIKFNHLRTQGAFDVSAELKNGELKRVTIKSLAGNPCNVEMNFREGFEVFGKRNFFIRRKRDRFNRDYYNIDLKKGESITLRPPEPKE
jgi:hypothetical protein